MTAPIVQSVDQKENGLVKLALVGGAGIVLLFAAMLWLDGRGAARVVPDSRFVTTTLPKSGLPPFASWKDRVVVWLFRFQQRYRQRHPSPLSFSFPACPVSRCSIHGLLNQCMEVGGVQYLIPKEVASGSVQFGHSNVLNGVQWIAAFTAVLTNGQPEWWDSKAKSFRKENLVLVTNGPRTVWVLPQEMVAEFQQ